MSDTADDPDLRWLLENMRGYSVSPGECYPAAARCVCGKTRGQHDTQWPACRGFVAASGRLEELVSGQSR